jgi:hypothetical protein
VEHVDPRKARGYQIELVGADEGYGGRTPEKARLLLQKVRKCLRTSRGLAAIFMMEIVHGLNIMRIEYNGDIEFQLTHVIHREVVIHIGVVRPARA